ncbi:nuclear transport factor 2 family protein [Reyranella sp. CPCC 100927]|uniref:nuclear transport factor 2 family protein n=1 Tax=Reyranella sp. CPCC 100927 TaxID=2599616 RepID=UPI0011B389AE|nr:nuclear transport factor 2 family protein [Reyranella sp. CPCC 100927]TWT00700.1 nuclear transport factor 2 family protein [Reyranella sp. CPCC 100927]
MRGPRFTPLIGGIEDEDRDGVAEANRAFYRAFMRRDLEALDALWASATPVACLHPGQAPLFDRAAIMASWQAITRNPSTPHEIRIIEDRVVVRGRMGIVICREVLPNAHLMATNMFVREGDAWKIAHHQSAVAPPPKDRPTQPTAAPKRDRRQLH